MKIVLRQQKINNITGYNVDYTQNSSDKRKEFNTAAAGFFRPVEIFFHGNAR